MLKCKKCGCSDFGVEARQVMAMPYRLTNGEQTPLAEQADVKNELEYKFCFGCNAPITEADLYEKANCATCGNEVDELIDGNCVACNDKIVKAKALEDKKKELNKKTKAELIEMLLSGEINQEELASAMTEPAPKKEAEPKVKEEAPKVAETAPAKKEEVVQEVKPSNALDKAIPNIEPNQEVNLNEEANPASEPVFEAPDVDVVCDDVQSHNKTDDNVELDILAQIDQAVDLASLNIQCEDINQQL